MECHEKCLCVRDTRELKAAREALYACQCLRELSSAGRRRILQPGLWVSHLCDHLRVFSEYHCGSFKNGCVSPLEVRHQFGCCELFYRVNCLFLDALKPER